MKKKKKRQSIYYNIFRDIIPEVVQEVKELTPEMIYDNLFENIVYSTNVLFYIIIRKNYLIHHHMYVQY